MFCAINITMAGLVSIVITLLIFACIVGLLLYIIHVIPIPAPYKGWLQIVLHVLVALVLIGLLLNFAGFPIVRLQ